MKRKVEPCHLLVDWAFVACRGGKQDTSKILTSRDPGDVDCKRCQKATPEYADTYARQKEASKE